MCITCKGRTPHLRRTLEINLRDNPGTNAVFVLLDYGSEDGTAEFIRDQHSDSIASGKLVYYRYEAARFKMAHAKNMAHRLGVREGGDVLVNLDADNLAGPGFADYVEGVFTATALDPQEVFLWSRMIKGVLQRGVNGRIAVSRNAFLISGGYDEKYETYSPDDKDFNFRLRRLGFCAQEIDPRYLGAIKHSDRIRFREYPEARDYTTAAASVGTIHNNGRVVNDGVIGCGTVCRNFDPTPIVLGIIPTRLFGIGAHKTATRSLASALAILGFKTGHWENPYWAKMIWTEMRELGRSSILERFYALCDQPIDQLYRELDRAYPNSRFILTTRSEADWVESARNHFNPQLNPWVKTWHTDPFTHKMHNRIYGRKTFEEGAFLAAYRRHNAEVLEYFKDRPSDLLVMDMSRGDGWLELCPFLDVPIPDVAYPIAGVTPCEPPPDPSPPDNGSR
jgi:hypothetical protein